MTTKTATTQEIVTDETINDAVQGNLSPYALIKVLNELTGRNLPTQMAYNYAKKGMIPTLTNELGKKYVTRDNAVAFIVKYVNTNIRKVTPEVPAE